MKLNLLPSLILYCVLITSTKFFSFFSENLELMQWAGQLVFGFTSALQEQEILEPLS